MSEETSDEHYLKAATELGDSQRVYAHQGIYASNGVKLVERGVRVDSRLYQRLLDHRLQLPIENCLTAENALTLDGLREEAAAIIAERSFYALLASQTDDRNRMLDAIASIALPKAMAFRLTVTHERRREIFRHSLQMAIISLHLGLRQELKPGQLRALAAAALLHDIGMLHINPEILDGGHQFDAAERRQLLAHPLTGAMIVQQYPEYPQSVARAILEHHERHDGSGYPRGLKGDEIGILGRILLLAEVVTAVLDKKVTSPEKRLSLILRLNHSKFDTALLAVILRLMETEASNNALLKLAEEEEAAGDGPAAERNANRLQRLGEELAEWGRVRSQLDGYAARAPAAGAFLTARVAVLERSLADAGLHPDDFASISLDIRDQPAAINELAMLAREAGWQLHAIIQDVFCRFPRLETSDDPGEQAMCDWLGRLRARLTGGTLPSSTP